MAAAGEAWRLFLALWPPPAARDQLARVQASWSWPEAAKPVKPERLHVTVHFIGPVAAARVGDLERGLRVPFESFTLGFEGARPQVWRDGIAVLELQAPPALLRLHAALAQALRSLDLPVEDRPYRPHVTFARKAFGSRPPRAMPAVGWHAQDGYALVRTVPGRGYENVFAYR